MFYIKENLNDTISISGSDRRYCNRTGHETGKA